MGRLSYTGIPAVRDEDGPRDPFLLENGPQEIGSLPADRTGKARRIERDPEGWRFGEEVEVEVSFRRRPVSRAWSCFRLEVRIEQRLLREGESLVLTEYPWSTEWVAAEPFRGRAHGAKVDPADWEEATPLQLFQRLRGLDHDPWLTSKDAMVAGLPDPRFAFREDERNVRRKDLVFGLCASFDAAARETYASAAGRACLASVANESVYLPQGELRRPLRTFDSAVRLRCKEEASALLWLSAQQSLAGPLADDDPVDLPVLLQEIFADHLNRVAHQEYRAGKRSVGSAALEAVAVPPEPDPAAREAMLSAIERELKEKPASRRRAAEALLQVGWSLGP